MKRNTTDGRKLGFCLIGDPALRLSYPQYNVSITSINEKPVGDSVVQFKAFEKVTISGYIQDALGNTKMISQDNWMSKFSMVKPM